MERGKKGGREKRRERGRKKSRKKEREGGETYKPSCCCPMLKTFPI